MTSMLMLAAAGLGYPVLLAWLAQHRVDPTGGPASDGTSRPTAGVYQGVLLLIAVVSVYGYVLR
jgi:hypothetical protein